MNIVLRNVILIFSFCLYALMGFAQKRESLFVAPFDFPLYLSGNFGELRTDHFHSGVDFKTQGVVGKHIRSVADGYICRASVTPGGYGKALYVMHDNGYMTVYAHLDRFPPIVEKRVREHQYKNETFSTNLWFPRNELRVKQGEFLAYAGNSGYSFGPHLHFEIRDAKGNELYDPMEFYKNKLIDTRPPRIHAVSLYPQRGKGVVNCNPASCVYDVKGDTLCGVVEAWGVVGFGVKALDYMDGTNNKYGIRKIELFVDGKKRFSSVIDNFSFSEDLFINSWIDYGRMYNDGEWFQKLFVAENNKLRVLDADENDGWLLVDEERDYNIEYRLSDYHGNSAVCSFVVKGKRCEIPLPSKYTHALYCNANNRAEYFGMRLDVPAGVLFEDAFLNVRLQNSDAVTWRYSLADTVYPMLKGAKISFWVGNRLSVDKSKLYIRHVEPDDSSSVGGVFEDGWVSASITTIDCYEVAVDTVAPLLRPVNEDKWRSKGKITLSFEENETSLKNFRGTLDGKFILFEYNSKNKEFTLDMKNEKVKRGTHQLHFVAIDRCGNEAVFERSIEY